MRAWSSVPSRVVVFWTVHSNVPSLRSTAVRVRCRIAVVPELAPAAVEPQVLQPQVSLTDPLLSAKRPPYSCQLALLQTRQDLFFRSFHRFPFWAASGCREPLMSTWFRSRRATSAARPRACGRRVSSQHQHRTDSERCAAASPRERRVDGD